MGNKLLSMVDFVLEKANENRPCDRGSILQEIVNYAEFLKRPLELGQFVPCDENNIPLKPVFGKESDMYYVDEFEKSQKRILFEGFEVKNSEILGSLNEIHLKKIGETQCWAEIKKDSLFFRYPNYLVKTIEDLSKYNLTITNNALKLWQE